MFKYILIEYITSVPIVIICIFWLFSACKGNLCGEHGVCKKDRKSDTGFKCTCTNGYSGALCDISKV